jgi:hypothetical protein
MSIYRDYQREPSRRRQCMYHTEKDGIRCRAIAMHNEYMCYQHRNDEIATVIQNDPFEIVHLDDRAAIQKALADTAARLACNHIDLKRAALLIQNLQVACSNLTAYEKEAGRLPIPQPEPELLPDPVLPPTEDDEPAEAHYNRNAPEVVIVRKPKRPAPAPEPVVPQKENTVIAPEEKTVIAPEENAVILSEAPERARGESNGVQSKDPEESSPTPTDHTIPPLQPATNNPQPTTLPTPQVAATRTSHPTSNPALRTSNPQKRSRTRGPSRP